MPASKPKTPSKRWRLIVAGEATDYRTEIGTHHLIVLAAKNPDA